jgi:hypothetical protein
MAEIADLNAAARKPTCQDISSSVHEGRGIGDKER